MLPGLPFLNWQPEVFLLYPCYEIVLANATSNNFNCFFVRLKEVLCVFNIMFTEHEYNSSKKIIVIDEEIARISGI